MRIKIDKQYVENYQLERVKEDMKSFSESFTLEDLRTAFETQTGTYLGWNPKILNTEIFAMDSGWATGNQTIFDVYMLIDSGLDVLYKIQFYINMELNVDTRDLNGFDGKNYGKLYSVKKYKLESES